MTTFRILLSTFSIFCFHACFQSGKEIKQQSIKGNLDSIKKINQVPIKEKVEVKLLINNTIEHYFSSSKTKDTFSISLIGTELNNANVIFSIKNSRGISIYNDTFPSYDLLNYGFVLKPDVKENEDKQRVNFIRDRVNKFFSKDNFFQPAIKITEKYNAFEEENIIDKKTWNEIKKDKTAIGFYYLVGVEDNRKIVFSKKQQKTLLYYNYD